MSRPVDFAAELVGSARKTISEGYYLVADSGLPHRSLLSAMRSRKVPLIAEVKFTSPAEGALRKPANPGEIARLYEAGGAAGISVLTEPKHFDGRLEYLAEVKRAVSLPVLMKDVIVDMAQVDAAKRIGADAILLMASVYSGGLAPHGLEEMIEYSHFKGLEVLLEAHTEEEYALALKTDADIVGINNRDLSTLEVSLETSRRLLKAVPHTKPVICESGISSRAQILELQSLGADGFLVGSSLMKSREIERAVRSLVTG